MTPPKTPEPASDRSSVDSSDTEHTPGVLVEHLARIAVRPDAAGRIRAPAAQPVAAEVMARYGRVPVLVADYVKRKLPRSSYPSDVKMEVIHLMERDTTTTRYFMSKAFEQGGSGKFKYAMTSAGKMVAIKEMRMALSRTPARPSAMGRPKTKVMAREKIQLEAAKTAINRRIIDDDIAQQIAHQKGHDPLGHLRGTPTRYEVLESIEIDTKVHLVSSIEAGDLWSLHQNIPIDTRGPLSLSCAAQTFSELSAMHAAGWMHLDLKMENLLFGENGQVKIIDFGEAIQTQKGVAPQHIQGLIGSNFTPEMLPDLSQGATGSAARPTLTSASDVWSAGASIFEVLQRHGMFTNPFEAVVTASGQIDQHATAEAFAAFEIWRQRAVRADGSLDPKVLSEPNDISQWITRCYVLMPQLVTTLVRDVMVADPAKRVSAADLADALRTQVSQLTPKRTAKVREFFARNEGVGKIAYVERQFTSYAKAQEAARQKTDASLNRMIR